MIDKDIIPVNWREENSIIKVIGVGGGGCNAVSEMFRQGIKDVTFAISNTDIQQLNLSPVLTKLQIGVNLTKGLGAGCNPTQGRDAALESKASIEKLLTDNTQMLFIAAGMGGGTGTGAAPVIAEVAKSKDILTVGVVTLPFRDEGVEFMKRAINGIKELEKHVDSLLIIDNQNLYKIYDMDSIFEALPKSDQIWGKAVKSIADIVTTTGFINVDFADLKMVMKDSGMAVIGIGTASGSNRAELAVKEAFNSPLLNDIDLATAKSVLVNISSSKDYGLKMNELSQIMQLVSEYTGIAENFKRGIVLDDTLGESISVTVVATGFSTNAIPQISEDGKKLVERVKLNLPETDIRGGVIRETIVSNPHKTQKFGSSSTHSTTNREKPALVVGPGDKISDLENIPAYIRKSKAAENQNDSSNNVKEKFKLEEFEGKQILSEENSYLHKTQD